MSAHKKVPRPEGVTRAQLVREAKALVEVAKDAMRVADTGDTHHMVKPNCGICRNWRMRLGLDLAIVSYRRVEAVSPHWPKFSGTPYFPVPGDCRVSEWEGMNLADRLDLIAFILNCYAHWLSEPKRKRGAA